MAVIIYIFGKKFPVLANVDVENIPKEKEARVKEQIISGRLKRSLVKWSAKATRFLRIAHDGSAKAFHSILARLHALRDDYNQKAAIARETPEERARQLFTQALELKNQDDLVEAEKKLIEIISFDSKNREAFELLGEVYLEGKKLNEAKETYKHVLKLAEAEEEEPADVYFNLAVAERESGNAEAAIRYQKRALKIQPNSPRYLDAMIEVAILAKDKVSAWEALERLKTVNPENQKLEQFASQIKEL